MSNSRILDLPRTRRGRTWRSRVLGLRCIRNLLRDSQTRGRQRSRNRTRTTSSITRSQSRSTRAKAGRESTESSSFQGASRKCGASSSLGNCLWLNQWVAETRYWWITDSQLRPAKLRLHTEVARDAAPLATETYPRIREASATLERFPLVFPLLEIGSGHDRGAAVLVNFHVL